ncbi:MAG: hypothetical protein LBV23_12135 [Deltaproteobacteria bacterium]|jgi:hypothetical protein|nr:hypothetical protein [Deltaproteobacteria bacterium]
MEPYLSDIFESAMLVTFGVAWPANILNSLRVKSSRGRSVTFLKIIILGYIFGLAAKFLSSKPINYVVFFYFLNLIMVGIDLFLYYYYLNKEKPKHL